MCSFDTVRATLHGCWTMYPSPVLMPARSPTSCFTPPASSTSDDPVRWSGGAVRIAAFLCVAVLAGCGGPTAPTGGSATVTVTGASVANGGSTVWGRGVDVSLTITASDDLIRTIRNVHVGAGRVAFYVCLSEDGVHFTSQCSAGLGVGAVQARVIGPSESLGIAVTSHLIAFVIPPEDYGVPVTAFVRFLGGDTVPPSALAVHVLPWRIEWHGAEGAAGNGQQAAGSGQ